MHAYFADGYVLFCPKIAEYLVYGLLAVAYFIGRRFIV